MIRSVWLDNKDEVILRRIEKEPHREKELLALSDKADKLIMKLRKHNAEVEGRNF
jgi:hypothetical protein